MQLPEPGSYRAQQNGTIIVRQEESGSLMAYIPYSLIGAAFMGVHNLTLGAKDGTPQTKNINALKQVFPNWDFENLADIEMPAEGEEAPQFDLADCYHDDSYTPEGASEPTVQFKAKWFNVIGGGRKQAMSQDERKAALTRWKSKLKAVASAAPTVKKAPAKAAPAEEEEPELPTAKPAPAPKKAAASGPPSRKSTGATARTSSQEEVWNGLVKARGEDADQDGLAAEYYDACDKVVEGSSADPSLLDTPAKWGKVADALSV